jgi:hypothetical protein
LAHRAQPARGGIENHAEGQRPYRGTRWQRMKAHLARQGCRKPGPPDSDRAGQRSTVCGQNTLPLSTGGERRTPVGKNYDAALESPAAPNESADCAESRRTLSNHSCRRHQRCHGHTWSIVQRAPSGQRCRATSPPTRSLSTRQTAFLGAGFRYRVCGVSVVASASWWRLLLEINQWEELARRDGFHYRSQHTNAVALGNLERGAQRPFISTREDE